MTPSGTNPGRQTVTAFCRAALPFGTASCGNNVFVILSEAKNLSSISSQARKRKTIEVLRFASE